MTDEIRFSTVSLSLSNFPYTKFLSLYTYQLAISIFFSLYFFFSTCKTCRAQSRVLQAKPAYLGWRGWSTGKSRGSKAWQAPYEPCLFLDFHARIVTMDPKPPRNSRTVIISLSETTRSPYNPVHSLQWLRGARPSSRVPRRRTTPPHHTYRVQAYTAT